jgi:hypothetical protein
MFPSHLNNYIYKEMRIILKWERSVKRKQMVGLQKQYIVLPNILTSGTPAL